MRRGMVTKDDLRLRVSDLEAEIQELRAENARLRAGRTAYWDRWARKWLMPVERVEDTGMLDRVRALVSECCGEGETLRHGDLSLDGAHWSAEYRWFYRDDTHRICPMGRWWIIRYDYDSFDGSDVYEVWTAVEVRDA